MALLPDEAYTAPAHWRARLRAGGSLAETLADLAQAWPWLPAEGRAELTALLETHPGRSAANPAEHWVEGVFTALGFDAETLLEAHAQGDDGSPESRHRAAVRHAQLAQWRDARESLPQVAPNGGWAPPAAFRQPHAPEIRQSDALAWIAGWDLGAHRDALLKGGVAPALMADCDHTLWAGDIGDVLYWRAIRERWLLPAARGPLRALLDEVGMASTGDPHDDAAALGEAFNNGGLHEHGAARGLEKRAVTRRYYAANTFVFAGHTIGQLKRWATEEFARGFAGRVFVGARALFDTAEARGLLTGTVSASSQWFVEVGSSHLGVPPWRAAGVRLRVVKGVMSPEIDEPLTYGPGKLEIARALCGGRPLISIGDSMHSTDRELLEGAVIRWVVGAKGDDLSLLAARAADNWSALRFEGTVT